LSSLKDNHSLHYYYH